MSLQYLPEPGDVIEFIEHGRMYAAVCLGSRKSRTHLLTETGRSIHLAAQRILHVSVQRLDVTISRREMIQTLRNISDQRRKRAEVLDPGTAWQASGDKGVTISVREAVSRIPDADATSDDWCAAFIRAVFRGRSYFKLAGRQLYVFTEAEVAAARAKQEEATREKTIIENLSQWLDRRLAKGETAEPPPDDYERLIAALEADAAGAGEQPDKKWLSRILSHRPHPSGMSSFQILVHLGIFSSDENLHLIRSGYPRKFSKDALADLAVITESHDFKSSKRLDLTALECMTIDGPVTRDMDDAISWHPTGHGTIELGVHITDISAWIPPGSSLDEEALERGQTLYLPEKTWHMFPDSFSENTASLRQSEIRPVISTRVLLNSDLEIENVSFTPSLIRVRQRLTYDDLDARIDSEPFKSMLELARHLRHQRIESGAIIMPRPELTIDATDPRRIVIRKRGRQADSQLIVSECMILANRLAAEKVAAEGLPFPFRAQTAPKDSVPRSDNEFNPYVSYCQRRMMPRAENSLTPRPHFSLGLDAYTNVTSPLRRYFDVLAQRQLRAAMHLDEPYSREQLEDLLHELEQNMSRAQFIAHNRTRYWMLKYLAAFKGKTIKAMVLDRFQNRYQIWLENLCMDAELPLSFGHSLVPEQRIDVVIEQVSPRDNVLKLRLAG